jgi:hypothetical protein
MISDLGSEFLLKIEYDITSFWGILIQTSPDKALLLSMAGLTNWFLATSGMTYCKCQGDT